jgi:hypothetical protein
MRFRTIHGILAALAFVILFPSGSILLRTIPGRLSVWVHAAAQVIAYMVYIAGAGLGIWMVKEVKIPFSAGGLVSLGRLFVTAASTVG